MVQVKQEEYDAFFKQTFKEFLEPLAHSHFNVEGTIEFTAMLFVPGMAPFEQQVRYRLALLHVQLCICDRGNVRHSGHVSKGHDATMAMGRTESTTELSLIITPVCIGSCVVTPCVICRCTGCICHH